MNSRSGRPGARWTSWTQSGMRVLVARLLREVAGDDALVAVPPGLAAVVGEPDADGRDRDASVAGRPARARSSAGRGRRRRASSRAASGAPRTPRFSCPGEAAVAALEQHARVAARVEQPVGLAGRRSPRSARAPSRRPRAASMPSACSHSPVGVVGDPDLRAVERGGRPTRGSGRCAGRASRTRPARPANARAVISNAGRPARPRARTGPSSCRPAARSFLALLPVPLSCPRPAWGEPGRDAGRVGGGVMGCE